MFVCFLRSFPLVISYLPIFFFCNTVENDEEGTINPMAVLLVPKPIDDSTVVIDYEKLHEMFAKKTSKVKKNYCYCCACIVHQFDTTAWLTFTPSHLHQPVDDKKDDNKTVKKGPVTLVDGKRQQNVGISLSRFTQRGLSSVEIARALLHCDENVLTSDTLSSM